MLVEDECKALCLFHMAEFSLVSKQKLKSASKQLGELAEWSISVTHPDPQRVPAMSVHCDLHTL